MPPTRDVPTTTGWYYATCIDHHIENYVAEQECVFVIVAENGVRVTSVLWENPRPTSFIYHGPVVFPPVQMARKLEG